MQSTICCDIGNYSTLISTVTGRTVSPILMMRSLVLNVTHNSEVREGVYNSENPLVVVNHKHYKLGRQAGLFHGHLSAAEAGKSRSDIALPLLLAATPQDFEGEVKLLVPRRDAESEKLLQAAIVGTHEFCVNGRDASANFTSVSFYEETKSAAKFAFESGVIAPNDVVLCVDIGGGTFNAAVCAYDDDVFNTRFYKSYANSGGIALAKAISNTDVVKSFAKAVDTSTILDSITEGKTYIGNRPDYSFADVFGDCVNTWFDALLTRVLSDVEEHLDQVTLVLWCGGGASIIRDQLIQPGQVVLENPQFANINALIHFSKSPHLVAVA